MPVRSSLAQTLMSSSFALPSILSAQEAKPQERQREPCTLEELEDTEWLDWIHRKVSDRYVLLVTFASPPRAGVSTGEP